LNSAQYGNPAANESARKIMAKKTTLSIISNGKRKSNDGIINPRSSGKHDVELGRRLRLRRVEQKMSQSELADKLGVSFQQVQKYEKGVNRVGASRLQQVATALDVPITFFFDDADAGKRANNSKREVESLLFLDSSFSLRLLRAYSAVTDQAVQRQFVTLIESIAADE
jgi:transcriptional regulator with XRE-family HTH domain